MNREYNPNTALVRFAFFAAAVVMTSSVAGFVDSLATSYAADSVQAKQSRPVVTASR